MINFAQIGVTISNAFDSDRIDIKREVDGKLMEIYSNVACHIAYSSVDNPDPNLIDVKPVIQSLTIHMNNYVDIRNDDYIVAKKMGANNEILFTYGGRCGNPVVSQGRKKVSMIMNKAIDDSEPIIQDAVYVQVSYFADDIELAKSETLQFKRGSNVLIAPKEFDGYTHIETLVDDESTEMVDIQNIQKNVKVKFKYEIKTDYKYIRILTNGIYTNNDGSLAIGNHLYKKINIISWRTIDSGYELIAINNKYVHEDSGKNISLEIGTVFKLYPDNLWFKVVNLEDKMDYKVILRCVEYEPTKEEANAYMTKWYDEL